MRSRARRRGAPEFSALSVEPARLTALTEWGVGWMIRAYKFLMRPTARQAFDVVNQ